jgi:hypothetical protein
MYNLNENHDLISNLAAMLGHFPNLSDLLCTFIVELNVSEHVSLFREISRIFEALEFFRHFVSFFKYHCFF